MVWFIFSMTGETNTSHEIYFPVLGTERTSQSTWSKLQHPQLGLQDHLGFLYEIINEMKLLKWRNQSPLRCD